MAETPQPNAPHSIRSIFITGLLTVIPLWLTWLVVAFLFKTLSAVGEPLVRWAATQIQPHSSKMESFLTSQIFYNLVACILVILLIYLLGMLTMFVAGQKMVAFFESFLNRLPLVKTIYGSVKKLTTVLQEKPADDVQRVVLIDFPSPEMKTVGLVTRVLDDAVTGKKLAAVYVPTTPNPTSGYLEIIPVERLTPTQWTMDEAMSFIVSGGAIAPDTIIYDRENCPTQQGMTDDTAGSVD